MWADVLDEGLLPLLHHLDGHLHLLLHRLGGWGFLRPAEVRGAVWLLGVRALISLAISSFPLHDEHSLTLMMSVPVRLARRGAGLEGLPLVPLAKSLQLRSDLGLPLPPLSFQELERFGWDLVALRVPLPETVAAGSASGTTADDFVKRQVDVSGRGGRSELLLTLFELLQLPFQQRVLQLDLRARPHPVPLPLLLSQHHLEGSGDGDFGVGPDSGPCLMGPSPLRFWLESEVLLGCRLLRTEPDVPGWRQNKTKFVIWSSISFSVWLVTNLSNVWSWSKVQLSSSPQGSDWSEPLDVSWKSSSSWELILCSLLVGPPPRREPLHFLSKRWFK